MATKPTPKPPTKPIYGAGRPHPDHELPGHGHPDQELPDTPEAVPVKKLRDLFDELEGKIHGLSKGSELTEEQIANIKESAAELKAELDTLEE
jgi:hypothetical protein